MKDDAPVSSIRFDAASVGGQNGYDAWRETVRCVYDVEPLCDDENQTESLEGWLVDNLIASVVTFSHQTFSHHSRHAQDSNYLSLQIYMSGGAAGILADRSWEMKPGDVHIFDYSREFHSVAQNSVVAGLTIPHEALGYDPGKHPAYLKFSANSSVGRFLADAYFAFQSRLPRLQQNEAAVLAASLCGLLRGIVCSDIQDVSSEVRKSREERRMAMRSYLDRNLSNPDLGIKQLLDTFGVSRPSIYRGFADVGGVEAYITRRRLDRAFYQLLSASPTQARVSEIAHRLGFRDSSHFGRLFRQQFGITPGSVKTNRQVSDAATQWSRQGETPQLADWIGGI